MSCIRSDDAGLAGVMRGEAGEIAIALIRERRTVGMGEGEKTKGRREWRSGISRAKSQAKRKRKRN